MDESEGAETTGPSAADLMLQQIDPDSLTPREALDLLYRLKSLGGD